MARSETTVASIETWACALPLDEPLHFGSFTVSKREYTVVRLRTHGGLEAAAIGLSRGLPVDVAVADVFAPLLVGAEAVDVEERTRERVARLGNIERAGVAGSAWSLLDICLWDLRAQARGVPLWQLLGGTARELPVLLVEGYALPGEDDEAFAARLAGRVAQGYSALKIEGASSSDPERLRRRLEAVRAAVGPDVALVVDLAWKHRDAASAARDIAVWDDVDPAWVEDPFPRELIAEYPRLRGLVSVPIGGGDEATREEELAAIVELGALDIVRCDATTIGGITAATRIATLAAASHLGLSAHSHPEIHRHLLLAWPGSAFVECFPPDRPFDLEHRLQEEPITVSDGAVAAPRSPGTGLRLDNAAVARAAVRRSTTA
jgi:L-alanine-DL-glutamate epimerase-like enolase superfamily enzyme